jgi:hypothetical protein
MKTLILAIALSLIPAAAFAQAAPGADASSCTMANLYTTILPRAKGQFEAVIRSALTKKFGKDVSYVITEIMQIVPNPGASGGYLLSISEVRIETPRKNILTLNVPAIVLYSDEAKFSIKYDDEGAFRAQTCSANFVGYISPDTVIDTTIINASTQVFVAAVDLSSLSVSGFEIIKSK